MPALGVVSILMLDVQVLPDEKSLSSKSIEEFLSGLGKTLEVVFKVRETRKN